MKATRATKSKGNNKGISTDTVAQYTWATFGHAAYWDPEPKQWRRVDTTKARLYFSGGRVSYYDDQALAYFVWLHLPKGIRVAFRGANDTTPVYPWDYVDAL